MPTQLFPIRMDVGKPNRFLLCLELRELGRLIGNPIESFSLFSIESGNNTSMNPQAIHGGIIIPLHGSVRITHVSEGQSVDVPIAVSLTPEPFTGYLVQNPRSVQVTNNGKDVARVLCLSGSTHKLLQEDGFHLTQEEFLRRFKREAVWIYINNLMDTGSPAGNHYHTQTHKLFVPVHGAFEVHLVTLDTKTSTCRILIADADDERHHELAIPPMIAHAVVKRSKRDPVNRLLVISTTQPRDEDTIDHPVIPLS